MRPRAAALALATAALLLSADAHATTVVANSLTEFSYSGIQGENNWYYGYYEAGNTADFTQLPWDTNLQRWGLLASTPVLWASGAHPKATASGWAVRRWIVEVDGPVTVELDLRKTDTGGGDGVTGRLFLDGIEVWSQTISGTDGAGVQTSLPLTVTVGQTLDLAVDAGGTEFYDSTYFTARITTAVPEPGSLGALAVSLLALPIAWRAARARRRAAPPAAGTASS